MVVRAADGHEYVIEVCPAKKISAWWHGPDRWWATLRRDPTTWLTVELDDVHWPVLRERFGTLEEATARAAAIQKRLRSGRRA
jgi:hypothetical protein